jgi:hypothetical protein
MNIQMNLLVHICHMSYKLTYDNTWYAYTIRWFDSLPWTYPLLSRWFIGEEQTSRSMCIRVVLIKKTTFLSGTIITGNDVIDFENEVQCIFCCSSLQWSYYALSYIIFEKGVDMFMAGYQILQLDTHLSKGTTLLLLLFYISQSHQGLH